MALFSTERTRVHRATVAHAGLLQAYYVNNAKHLRVWEPRRGAGYNSEPSWRRRLLEYETEYRHCTSLRLVALDLSGGEVLGVCNFTNIARGAFQACNVGYSVACRSEGRGLMTEVLAASLDHVFRELDLHRVMANYVPQNHRSARLLNRLGFVKEGFARSYLMIDGKWQDHVLTSRLNPSHS